jgi:potassium efflux system protein
VAYGSDPEQARRVILEAVRSVPLVRNDPEPRVFFMGFGDSALNFDVYAFASELADRLPIVNDVHVAVERALRQHGIEIPFPQRDIHIRSAPPGFGPLFPAAPVTAKEGPAP